MGVTQGQSLSHAIRSTYEVLRELEAFRLKQPCWLPFSWFRRLAARKAHRSVAPVIQAAAPALYQRVQGIAHGSGLDQSSLWLIHALEGFLANLRDIADIPPPCGCSALAIRGPLSATGEPIIAHNFDYLALIQPYYTIRESRPSGGFRSLEFTAAPLAGTVDGINEHGLAVTYNYGATIDQETIAPTISMRISEVLARFRTVPEAVDWLMHCPRWGSGLLMLADQQGALASVELSPTAAAMRQPRDGENYLFHANKFQCDSTKAVEVPIEAVFNRRAPRPRRGHRVYESSLKRIARFTELLSGAGPLSLEGLQKIMADHGKEARPSDTTICMHSDYWVTTACIQCLPRTRSIRVSYSTACQANYAEFAL
jgi:hypothetical protein